MAGVAPPHEHFGSRAGDGMKPHDLPPMGCERRADANERLQAAQPLPTSQEVADVLSRAYDATQDVIYLLDESRICPTPGSLEHVAFAALIERVVPQGRAFAERLSHYLRHLPGSTEARRHQIPVYDDYPF